MKTLNLNEMEIVNGGACSESANQAIATIGAVATVVSFFGPIGAIIAGPTAAGMAIAGLVCAYQT